MHCQIETLRFCIPPNIRRVLDELPETLDATYERTLLGINKQAREYAHRMFQCLVISIRPLHVEELADLFAILSEEFNTGWRPDDPEDFILSTCSTFVSVVDVGGKKVVQFSHFSVREYLTSNRIANSENVSYFHILPKPSHTLLARACLSVLLQLGNSIDKSKLRNFPLVSYAAEHWVEHARFEDVASDLRDEMVRLFDRNKPHLSAWIWLYDLEKNRRRDNPPPHPTQLDAVPLYYAALCGIRVLVEHLLEIHPQDVNAWDEHHEIPLHAAVDKQHADTVLLLLERGADVEFRSSNGQTPLYMASSRGHTTIVQSLISHSADLNAECDNNYGPWHVVWTPLLVATRNGRLEAVRVLLESVADMNYQDNLGKSVMHLALRHPSTDLAKLLLSSGANPNALDRWGNTAMHDASSSGQIRFIKLLLVYGANVNSRNKSGWSPLHYAARGGHLRVVRLLLEYGAEMNAQEGGFWTPLHLAAFNGRTRVVGALLKRGANPYSRTDRGNTPSQLASEDGHTEIARLLSDCTGERLEDFEWRNNLGQCILM